MLVLCLIYLVDSFIQLAVDLLETTIHYPLLVMTVALLAFANIKVKRIFN